jgi:hypothetical protein
MSFGVCTVSRCLIELKKPATKNSYLMKCQTTNPLLQRLHTSLVPYYNRVVQIGSRRVEVGDLHIFSFKAFLSSGKRLCIFTFHAACEIPLGWFS